MTDELTVAAVAAYVALPEPAQRGWVLDGFPATVAQVSGRGLERLRQRRKAEGTRQGGYVWKRRRPASIVSSPQIEIIHMLANISLTQRRLSINHTVPRVCSIVHSVAGYLYLVPDTHVGSPA